VLQPSSELPAEDRLGVRFQKVEVEDLCFEDNFLVSEEDENQLGAWTVRSGSWLLHTAADNAIARKNIEPDAKKRPLAEYSPNFYSLMGRGTNAVITAGHDFYDAYTISASLQVMPGEMGIVFYVQEDGTYHAFTIVATQDCHRVEMRLWRLQPGDPPDRRGLAAVTTELTHGQWVKVGVRTFQNRVQCWVDNSKVMDMPVELPIGGEFGLYADGESGVRFDDVSVRSNHDLDFMGVSRLRSHTLVERGRFFPKRRFFQLFPPRESGTFLEPPKAKEAQWLIVGCTAHRPHVFSSIFAPRNSAHEVGLLAGYKGPRHPYYRFRCQSSAAGRAFLLEKVSTNGTAVLEELRLPAPAKADLLRPFSLMCDATNRGELRLYHGQRLVLIHHVAEPVGGASGIYVGPETAVGISDPSYRFKREGLYRNQFEKNRAFLEDPYMRHWSSPEGQWIEQKDKSIWYKGDFFGRFLVRMPMIPGSEIHVGVQEGQTNGTRIVAAGNEGLVLLAGPERDAKTALASVPKDKLRSEPHGKAEKSTNQWYALHYEGLWLWVTSGGVPLLKHRLETPLAGTRMRIAGFTTEQLKYSYVERFNVRDHLFVESLHDWVINGGKWSVLNRFNCQPRWSHMDGESNDGLAALWTKYTYRGDFCVEMYAGIRHGPWYQRCGDLNLTMMTDDTTPSRGYTVTCTGWDFDHSQLFTRLHRHGKVIAESDKYLAPRRREGNVRKGYNPLIGEGRSVHGAWYYIKFRRIGKKLEYHFDNELVFSCEDEAPLREGSMGLWTFMNSMVVARVKIAAEHIKPKGFSFTPVSPEAEPRSVAPEPCQDLVANGRPLEAVTPANWTVDDPVGRSLLKFTQVPGSGPCLELRNVLGGGKMFAQCQLPPVPYPTLAGWHFHVRRTPAAQFNFHYSVGKLGEDGSYVPSRRFFHRISGTDFSKGPFKMTGTTSVPGSPVTNGLLRVQAPWTPVLVWLPTEGFAQHASDSNLLVKVEGFGNLQPSYVAQGLTGNGPREGYAAKNFCEIRFSPPTLSLATNQVPPPAFTLVNPGSKDAMFSGNSLADIQTHLASLPGTGLIRAVLHTERGDGRRSENDLAWLRLPEKPGVSCTWAKDLPNTVLLESDGAYPDRRFSFASVTVNSVPVTPLPNGLTGRLLPLPRSPQLTASPDKDLAVSLKSDGLAASFSLPWKTRPRSGAPALLRLEGLTPLMMTFEDRKLREPLKADAQRMRLRHFDPVQGTYLEVANIEAGHRLATPFAVDLALSEYPLFQFRYRGPRMAQVSLAFNRRYPVRLSEEYDKATAVAPNTPFVLDGKWHTWLGRAADGLTEHSLRSDLFAVAAVSLSSVHRVDQTGQYTQWHVDDLAFGPTVSRQEDLEFTPHYYGPDGVNSVTMAVRAGSEDYTALTPDQVKALGWKVIPNGKRSVPDISGMQDGVCHLFLKAVDSQGNVSPVSDIPFLLDRRPLKVSYTMVETDAPDSNGTLLDVSFATEGGAPLSLADLTIRWNSDKVNLPALGSKLTHTPDKETLSLNWPFIFRRQLDLCADGQKANIVVATIKDGAGNPSPDFTVPIKIDYAKDHTPPSLRQAKFPTNILWRTAWEANTANRSYFTARPRDATKLRREPAQEPWLRITPQEGKASILYEFSKTVWPLKSYPYVAFRIRRPAMQPEEKQKIQMVFDLDSDEKYVLSLTHPKGGKSRINLQSPIEWQSNVWHAVTLDLCELLTGKVEGAALEKTKVKQVKLTITEKGEEKPLNGPVDIQSVFVFAPWSEKDTVSMNAYDASGVAGVSWSCAKEDKALSLSPAALSAHGPGDGWLEMRVRDKAGNLSAPLHVPVYAAGKRP